jgi:hypothetical protein
MLNGNSASLAVIAYAQVNGSDGSTPYLNSGLVTARVGVGSYTLTLPADQGNLHSLIFVQILGATPLSYAADADETDPNGLIKTVNIGSSSTTAVDADFNVMICRSMLTAPAGSPA